MNRLEADVLVLGGGAAGIRAAVSARENGADVLMVTLDAIGSSGSTFSGISNGWGIQALVGDERTSENFEAFYDDIIRVGLGCCREKLVRILVEESGSCVEDLLSWGLEFKKNSQGNYLRSTGCFSQSKRAFITRDSKNIRQVFSSVLQQRSVRIVTGYVIELIVMEGECCGAWILSQTEGIVAVSAKSTILTMGGGVGVYQENMGNSGGHADGCGLAYRAGAKLVNLEFIQFALGVKRADGPGFFPMNAENVLEKVVDSDGRCVFNGDSIDHLTLQNALVERSKHMPFSCRSSSALVDIVIASRNQSNENLYFIDDSADHEPIQMFHVAHAFNGGVRIDANGESSVPGLFAAGEVAAGPHGADRIGGCMMTATQVFGKRAGYFASKRAKALRCVNDEIRPKHDAPYSNQSKEACGQFLGEIEIEVKKTMQTHAMVIRTEDGLQKCSERLDDLKKQLEDKSDFSRVDSANYIRVENLIIAAKLIAESARLRRKSRGAHLRKDFPPEHLVGLWKSLEAV